MVYAIDAYRPIAGECIVAILGFKGTLFSTSLFSFSSFDASRFSVSSKVRLDGMMSCEFCHPVVVIIVNEGQLVDSALSVLAMTFSFDWTEGTIFIA